MAEQRRSRVVVVGDALIDEIRDVAGSRDVVGGAALNVAVGATREAALLEHFGSYEAIRTARPEDLAAIRGIGPGLAARIHTTLSAESAGYRRTR